MYLSPNFCRFPSTTSYFRDTWLSEIGNALNDLSDIEHFTVKRSLYALYGSTYVDAKILVRFALQNAVFKTQGCRQTEMCRMTSK